MTFLSPVCGTFLSFDRSVMATLDLILNLTKQKGFCWACNAWLAEQMGVTEVTVSRRVSKLVKAGLIFRQRVGKKEWHIFPAFPVPADCKSPSEAIEQMIRQRYAKSQPAASPHAGAANKQTKKTKEIFNENKQQTANTYESSSTYSAYSTVVVTPVRTFPEEEAQTAPNGRSGACLAPIASLLQAIPEPPAESAGQAHAEISGEAAAPGVATLPEEEQAAPAATSEAKPEAAPVAAMEIVNSLHRCAGMGLRAAQLWAARQPAECLRLLAILGKISGVRNKAAWIIAALRDAEAGTPYAFIAPPEPKAPPKVAQEGETERKAQQRRTDADAVEKANEAAYAAIPEPDRAQWEAQVVAELSGFWRKRWSEGKGDARQIVCATILRNRAEK